MQAALADILLLEPLAQDTPERVLTLFLITLMPYSLVSPFMGVLVDRWSRRSILVSSSAARAVVITVIAATAAMTNEAILYAAALFVLGLGRLFLTTKGAVLPLLAEGRDLVAANSQSAGAGMVSALVGGAGGLAIAGAAGPRAALGFGTIVYVVAAVASSRLQLPDHHRGNHAALRTALAAVASDMIAGVRRIATDARAAIPLVSIFYIRTITMFGVLASLIAVKQQFGSGERAGRLTLVVVAVGAAGLGAFLASLAGARISDRISRSRLLTWGFAMVAASTLGLAISRRPVSLVAAMLVGGFGALLAKVSVDAAVQDAVADAFRGRAFASYDIVYNLASVTAGVILVTTASWSPEVALALAAGTTLVVAGVLRLLDARMGAT